MEYYAGIDVSLKESSVCIVDAKGKIVREIKVASEPEALVRYFDELELPVGRIGLEARHVKAALSAMTVKTDRKDARGIAQLLQMGWYRPVYAKLVAAGTVSNFVYGRAVAHQAAMALVNRSPKSTANWPFAIAHSLGATFHSFSVRFKTR